MRIIGVLLTILSVNVMAENLATLVLKRDASGDGGRPLPGSYDLHFATAFVAQGSYSGIRVTFKSCCQDTDHHQLNLFIPSHQDFQIGYESSQGAFTYTVPKTPFLFQSEQSTVVKDRFGRPRPMNITFSHWHRVAKQHWSEKSIEFTDCEIKINSLSIEGHQLSFSGIFNCQSEQAAASAGGQFSVEGKLGVSKVD